MSQCSSYWPDLSPKRQDLSQKALSHYSNPFDWRVARQMLHPWREALRVGRAWEVLRMVQSQLATYGQLRG